MTTTTATATATQAMATLDQFVSLLSSIDSEQGLEVNSELLDICRRKIDEVSTLMKVALRTKLTESFTASVNSRQPEFKPMSAPYARRYDIATTYPYEVVNRQTHERLTPSFDGKYPTLSLTKDDNYNSVVMVHRLIAKEIINDGEELEKEDNVDHKSQNRFNWNAEHLQVISAKSNQLNRGGSEWMDLSVLDDGWQMTKYTLSKTQQVIDISDEELYCRLTDEVDDKGYRIPEFYIYVEEMSAIRKCKITKDGGVRGLKGRTTYAIKKLMKHNPSPDEDDIFSEC